jgi:hypothetical protein
MEDWESTQTSEISDYKYAEALCQSVDISSPEKVICRNEFWIKDPPNVLFFALNRVGYDKEQQKIVKNCKKFQFDERIFIDQMLEDNIGRVTTIKRATTKLKDQAN